MFECFQIWFQNRRQNARRKSRPLLPHEILPASRQSLSAEASGDAAHTLTDRSPDGSFSSAHSSQESAAVSATGAVGDEDNQPTGARGSSLSGTIAITQPLHTCDTKSRAETKDNDQKGTEIAPGLRPGGSPVSPGIANDGPIIAAQKHILSPRASRPSLGYISNRRNIVTGNQPTPNTTQSAILPRQGFTHTHRDNQPRPLLKRTSSLVRLSLSLDGKAEVVMGEEDESVLPQPATWKAQAPRIGGLQRSKSAVDVIGGHCRRLSAGISQGPAIGRSRDARTWEFYCDSEARSTLSAQGHSGSASEAINLLRSRKKPPHSSINKRSAQPRTQESSKRLKAAPGLAQKQKLARATSSLARLQTTNGSETIEPTSSRTNKMPSPDIPGILDNLGDSDKENWVPGTKKVAEQRQPGNLSTKPILGENNTIPSHNTSFDVAMDREKLGRRHIARQYQILGPKANSEDSKPSEDSTLREPRSGSSMSSEEELDCVQNLLSLRKGCWR
ncbi:hypothetical protein GP486_003175 [Trichoglossum hirsutum]|uniref:Homeobox domain-containing protein n=1 Tax=Trichoglossum hirsutum TaxID=265104 RepID=A0A9P8RR16_9PEZI|nr:hypothetical protein GP486_003175 [Trichoglossum hirsutum]